MQIPQCYIITEGAITNLVFSVLSEKPCVYIDTPQDLPWLARVLFKYRKLGNVQGEIIIIGDEN